MEIVIIVLTLLITLGAPTLGILYLIKRKGPSASAGQISEPLGPRRRDGVLTFNDYRGIRRNVEVEDPRPGHSARYQRRHTARQRQQAKPWMK